MTLYLEQPSQLLLGRLPCDLPLQGGLSQAVEDVPQAEGLASPAGAGFQEQFDQREAEDDLLHEHVRVQHVVQTLAVHPTAGWSYPHGFVLGCFAEAAAGDPCEVRVQLETFVRVDY